MAAATSLPASEIISIKDYSKSKQISTVPSSYISLTNSDDDKEVVRELENQIPVIDVSLLVSDDPELHAKGVQDLGKACEDWGFFGVINHGIPDSLIDKIIRMCQEFHDMSSEEKQKYADNKGVSNPIRCGTSFNVKVENVHYWRDYLKIITHPNFAFPNKPHGLKEVGQEYCKLTRALAKKLLQGISESLGLEPNAIARATEFDTGFQHFIANVYPPCPEPELALGMPPHSDHGLLTLLTQNSIGGLQINHRGKWVNVNPLPNSILVNTADQLEAASNGRYRSILHRVVLNNKDTRMSIVTANGPNLDAIVGPVPELLEKEDPLFKGINYKDYFEIKQKSRLDGKTCLDRIRMPVRD